MAKPPNIQRWIGLDIHKAYFVAMGVDAEQQTVFGPHKIPNDQLETWIVKHLQPSDAIVMEMTTNTYLFYDTLVPYVGSVIAVHPPNVRLVTGVKVKTDKKAALALAQLHAAGLLTGVLDPACGSSRAPGSYRPESQNGPHGDAGQESAQFASDPHSPGKTCPTFQARAEILVGSPAARSHRKEHPSIEPGYPRVCRKASQGHRRGSAPGGSLG